VNLIGAVLTSQMGR